MVYWGLCLVLLAVAGFVLGLAAGMPGLGPPTNVALLLGVALLIAGLVNRARRHDQVGRHA